MADTVSSNILFEGTRCYSVHLTNESDGTGESGVVKVDKTNLGIDQEPDSLSVEEIEFNVDGFNYVTLHWDHASGDSVLAVLSGSGYKDYRYNGGLHDPKREMNDGTGDIVLTTDGAIDGASYDITLKLKLKYAS